MSYQDKAVKYYHIAGNAPKAYWMATAAAVAHPKTRRAGLRMASYGARATWNMGYGAMRGLAGTTLARGGTATMGTVAYTTVVYTGAALAGYALGATVGTAIARIGWGSKGQSDAVDLYTGKVSWDKYWDTVGNALD